MPLSPGRHLGSASLHLACSRDSFPPRSTPSQMGHEGFRLTERDCWFLESQQSLVAKAIEGQRQQVTPHESLTEPLADNTNDSTHRFTHTRTHTHTHTHTHTRFVTWVGNTARWVPKEHVYTDRVIHLKAVGCDWNSIAHHWVIEVRSGQRTKGSDDTIVVVAVPDNLFLRKPSMKLNLVDHRLYRQTTPCAWSRCRGVKFFMPTHWRRCVPIESSLKVGKRYYANAQVKSSSRWSMPKLLTPIARHFPDQYASCSAFQHSRLLRLHVSAGRPGPSAAGRLG